MTTSLDAGPANNTSNFNFKLLLALLYNPQQTRACYILENIKINVEVTNEVLMVIKTLKSCNSPGMDDKTNETIKYGGEKLYTEIIKSMKSIFIKSQIPVEWKSNL